MKGQKQAKFCTHCGAKLLDKNGKPVFELYDEELHKKSNILKLMLCNACGQVGDKYIECDGPLLLIDLVLQSKEAYRHVLFNGGYEGLIIRMALLTLICDGYIAWAQSAGAGEFFEQEYEFYLMCFKLVLALSAMLCIILIPCCLPVNLGKLLLGLLLSYCSRFCNLIALLWGPAHFQPELSLTDYFTSPDVMWTFISALFFISSVRVYQVTQGSRLGASVAHILVGHLGFHLIRLNSDILVSLSQINKRL